MKSTLCIASATLLSLLAGGCVIVDDHDDDGYYYDHDEHEPYFATVDRGEVLTADLGNGAGLFVEYAVGGRWTVWASCDTLLSARPCLWDVYVSAQTAITDLEARELESGEDIVEHGSDSSVVMFTTTESGMDAMTFSTEPGALIRLEVYLDGYEAPDYLVWANDGVQHGAPYMPVIFQPDAP